MPGTNDGAGEAGAGAGAARAGASSALLTCMLLSSSHSRLRFSMFL